LIEKGISIGGCVVFGDMVYFEGYAVSALIEYGDGVEESRVN